MNYAGFHKKGPYLDFEASITEGVSRLFKQEPEGDIKETLRAECLRQRCFARDLWLAMGNDPALPAQVSFIDEESKDERNKH